MTMKRIKVLILLLVLTTAVFASTTANPNASLIKYKSSDDNPQKTGKFIVEFEGSTQGVLYSDIGFSKAVTNIGSAGLEKTNFENNTLAMTYSTRNTSANTYTYTTSFYIYWYVSLNKAMTLSLSIDPSDGAAVTIEGKSYTYATDGTAGVTKKDLSWSNNKAMIASFGNIISVYHDNSEMKVTAVLSKYPKGNRIATLTLELRSNT
jgi:hypothetical protein